MSLSCAKTLWQSQWDGEELSFSLYVVDYNVTWDLVHAIENIFENSENQVEC